MSDATSPRSGRPKQWPKLPPPRVPEFERFLAAFREDQARQIRETEAGVVRGLELEARLLREAGQRDPGKGWEEKADELRRQIDHAHQGARRWLDYLHSGEFADRALQAWFDVVEAKIDRVFPAVLNRAKQADADRERLQQEIVRLSASQASAKEIAAEVARLLREQGGLPEGEEPGKDPWVPANTLWPDKFSKYKDLTKFRREHPEMFRNPS